MRLVRFPWSYGGGEALFLFSSDGSGILVGFL